MRIAVDAMGGDHAPHRPVAGALAALAEGGRDFEIVLVGDESQLAPLLPRESPFEYLSVLHAPEVIGMEESPAAALRRKRRSSIAEGIALQKRGLADAFVSAGNTGAVMAAALTSLGRIQGLARPAIVVVFPTQAEPCAVLDAGANAECKPHHLAQFALMGHVYAVEILGRATPRIGLLSIGEEAGKGNDLTVAAHALLAESGLDFVGNVEGRDVLRGAVDVVVTDGFTGNVLLKFGESFADFLASEVRREVSADPRAALGAWLMKPAFQRLQRRIDYAEYGGAPLLGVDGTVIICHGGSSVKAFRNAILLTRRAVRRDLANRIEHAIAGFGKRETPPPDPAKPVAASVVAAERGER
ncbi:MAG TPA: phosphate acyltransferase PlsX [Gemmatimonadota bacterium]|nr:phosphate acyltransferase PlsX [Gemmatimonadota bacterium]